ncbi:MAG: ATP-dependent helicase HrpB, partial [Pseudomonadota bacterium]
ILRSSLAGVILRMHALGLGRVADFDFLEPPRGKAIADGEQLLVELGALTEDLNLTDLGKELSRLPLDPRVGRMLLAARDQQALNEALIIASALSVQDVRDRPAEAQTQADQSHAKFKDDKSEFSGLLRLWQWLDDARGGPKSTPKLGSDDISAAKAKASGKPNANQAHATHKLSNRQYEQLLRQNFIHVRRVREWRDVHTQLHTVVAEHRWPINTRPATYEQLHTALLAGMLGNVGCKLDEPAQGTGPSGQYLGARGIKFFPHPGAQLRKKPGKWVVCAELVETTRLFGRGIAHIEPQWLERVAEHVLRRQLLDPHWEKRSGDVVALERATLYGLVVYSGRRTSYAKADPRAAREIFIRDALVAGEVDADALSRWGFLRDNLKLVEQVEQLEHKSRRQDVLVDESLIFAFYDQQLPDEVCNVRTLDAWWKTEGKANPRRLHLSRDELMRHTAAGITTEAFPHTIKLGGVDCKTEYLHEPGEARDGVTVTVPLFVLNQVNEDRLEWLVPGMLAQKVQALLKSLPQKPRARLVPLPETSSQIAQSLSEPETFGNGSLMNALLERVKQRTELDIKRNDFKLDMLATHLFMNLCVVDEHGRQLGMGRHLAALKSELGGQARSAFQALAQLKKMGSDSNLLPKSEIAKKTEPDPNFKAGERFTVWGFGELPELMEIQKGGQSLVGFPALVDGQDAVTIEVFDEPELAMARHRQGLRRLVALQIRDALKYLDKNLPDWQKMAVAYMGLGTEQELKQQILNLALDRAFLQDPLPQDATSFQRRIEEGRGRLTLIANEIARACGIVLNEWAQAARKLKDTRQAPDTCADVAQQLQRLMGKSFVEQTPWSQFQHMPRYLKAITLRLDKLRADPVRDAQRLAELKPLEQKFWRLVAERKGVQDARLNEFRWLLEELRVSLFAQELRTPQPVSIKRLEKAWAQLQH